MSRHDVWTYKFCCEQRSHGSDYLRHHLSAASWSTATTRNPLTIVAKLGPGKHDCPTGSAETSGAGCWRNCRRPHERRMAAQDPLSPRDQLQFRQCTGDGIKADFRSGSVHIEETEGIWRKLGHGM